MLRRMIVKEWKEKFGLVIFAFVGLLLFTWAVSAYSKDKETLDILVGTILFIFIPAFSLLLGASGFGSEFHDGAWSYLFSRPVKKWRIWLAKYVSLLTVLYAVALLFDLLIRVHPALRTAYLTFSFSVIGELSHGLLVYFLPLLLFTTAFSLSIVSDKPFHVLFLAALIWLVLQMVLTRVFGPILYRNDLYPAVDVIPIVFVILPVSFALASLLTLYRADFSQPQRRVWTFTKSAAAFFAAFIVLLGLFTLGTWRARSERYFYEIAPRADGFYFVSNKGFFKFDILSGRTEKIARFHTMWGGISLGGDQIAFVTYSLSGRRRGFPELRIMKSDGKEERLLVETWDPESPLYGNYIGRIRIAPEGDRVAFVSNSRSMGEKLWVINSDGSGLKGYGLGVPDIEYCLATWFANSGRSLFLLCTTKLKPGSKDQRTGAMFMRVALGSGQVEPLVDMIRKPYLASMPRADGWRSESGLLAYVQYDEELSRDILRVLDPETLEKGQVYAEDSVTGFRWNAAGDKLAFLTVEKKLGIYSQVENKVIKMAELKGYDLRWPSQAFCWTQDDQIVLRKFQGEISYLCILDANLTEQETIRLPHASYYPNKIWSAGNYIVVEDTERHQLWGVDLETNKWLRIY